jgi:hypothetical protein
MDEFKGIDTGGGRLDRRVVSCLQDTTESGFNGQAIDGKTNKEKAPLRNQVRFVVIGGDEEDRTPDLRIANATLSQLSYIPGEQVGHSKSSCGPAWS